MLRSLRRLMAPARISLAIGVAVLVLGGCSSGNGTPTGPTASDPVLVQPTDSPTVPPGSGLTTTTAPPATSAPPATTATTTSGGLAAAFSSPSLNIGCYVDSLGARCDIEDSDFAVPTKPASCLGVWGHGVVVGTSGVATFVCATDTTLGPSRVLAYGASTGVGPFECTSQESGMTCRNTETGDGFTLSRSDVDLF